MEKQDKEEMTRLLKEKLNNLKAEYTTLIRQDGRYNEVKTIREKLKQTNIH